MRHLFISARRWGPTTWGELLIACLLFCAAGAPSVAAMPIDDAGIPSLGEGIAVRVAQAAPAAACAARVAGSTTDYTTVQAAVDAAISGGTVLVAGDCIGVSTIDYATQAVRITKNLTIEGGYDSSNWAANPDPVTHPATVDAGSAGRVVYVASGKTVTLRYLNIAHGKGGNDGGGIYNWGDLTLEYSTVRDCSALQGGGIYNGGVGNLTVRHSLIAGNTASNSGAGIYAVSDGSMSISNSTLANNTATAEGGAIWSRTSGTLEQSTLAGNTASAGAALRLLGAGVGRTIQVKGTILADNTGSNCSATDTTVTDGTYNLDDDSSCGLTSAGTLHTNPVLGPLADNGGPTLTFEPTSASPVIDAGDPAYVAPSGDTDQRGLPRVMAGRIDIGAVEIQIGCWARAGETEYAGADASAIQNAVAAAPDGGTVRIAGVCEGVSDFDGTVQAVRIAKDLTLEGGYASGSWDVSDPVEHPTTVDAGGGGRVVYVAAGATVTLRNLNIAHGAAEDNGGGIYNAGAVTLERSTVRDSSAVLGGGIYNAGSLSVVRSLVAGNTASSHGAGIYSPSTATSLAISNSTLADNMATAQGGAIWSQAPAGTLEQCTLAANRASSGGGLYLAAALTVKGTIVAGNTGDNCAGTAPGNGGYNLDSAATCGFGTAGGSQSNKELSLGALEDHGGPTLTFEPPLYSPVVNAGDPAYVPPSGDTDQRGLTRVRGGRIDIGAVEVQTMCWATPNNGTTVYESEDAGAVQLAIDDTPTNGSAGHVKVAGICILSTGNQVAYIHNRSLTLEGGYDPTDWAAGPNPAVSPTTLDAAGAANVVSISSEYSWPATLRHLTITGARGAVDGDGGGVAVGKADVTIEGCTITGNHSIARGGGVYGGPVAGITIRDSTISSNTSTQYGGGVYAVRSLVMSDCVVSGNNSQGGGGVSVGDGIHTSGPLDVAAITRTAFDNNTSTDCGGGLRSAIYSDVTVTYSTFSNNRSTGDYYQDGGAICNAGGTLTVRSSTFADNQASDQGGAIFAYGTNNVSTSTFHHNSATTGKMTYRSSGNFTSYGNIFAGSGQAGYCVGGTTAGPFTNATYNLDDGDSCGFGASATNLVNTAPDLKSLGYYGGPTKTLPPKMGSPALDAGDPAYVADDATDQRGKRRVSLGLAESAAPRIDIGAVEIASSCFAAIDDDPAVAPDYISPSIYAYEDASAVQSAVAAAEGGDTVKVAGTCIVPPGATTVLQVNQSVTVEGGYALDAWGGSYPAIQPTTLDGAGRARVVSIPAGKTVTLSSLNITGGAYDGAGIHNSGTLTLANSNVYGNNTGDHSGSDLGGGLFNSGNATVERSAIYGNSAVDWGGGIYNSSTLSIKNSTVASNTAAWGGGLCNENGTSTIVGATFAGNTASPGEGANFYKRSAGSITVAASIIADPHGSNCRNQLVSAGYNRISDGSCLPDPLPAGSTDLLNATILLDDALALNGSSTMNFLPQSTADNAILDIIPQADCERLLDTDSPHDQRGRSRPRLGWLARPEFETYCDAGSVERGQEVWTVCGPPLNMSDRNPNGRCAYLTIADAMDAASDGDFVVVSGAVTETVTVDKSLIIRGPRPEEITPGTHMGVVQAGLAAPAADCTQGTSIFTIAAGSEVTIEDLNIRHGCAAQGGAINNAGTLQLKRVTLYDNFGNTGGAVYNTGALTVADSTITRNLGGVAGAGIHNAASATAVVKRSTVFANVLSGGAGSNLSNLGTMSVGGSILSAPGLAGQCSGTITSLGYNLVNGPACFTSSGTDRSGDPLLEALRDNGGATLTYAIPAESPAVDQGYPGTSDDCRSHAQGAQWIGMSDQRGRSRPFDVPNGLGGHCDAGAYEYGPRTLTVDATAEPDPAALLYRELQEALDDAFADDIVEVRSGAYTGNFIVYKDLTIRHAPIDVSRLSPELGVDVRAILQASARTVGEQRRLDQYAGTTLTVQGYDFTDASFEPSGLVTASLSGLTIRHGAGKQGGGVHNRGNLTIDGCTIENSAATNGLDKTSGAVIVKGEGGGIYNSGQLTLIRSTVSGNRAEYYGGALYNDGTAARATAAITATTLANNLASPLPDQHVVTFGDNGLSVSTLPVTSGDEIRFETRTSQTHTMAVQGPPEGVTCSPLSIEVPVIGAGLSVPLICTTDASVPTAPPNNSRTVIVKDPNYPAFELALTVTAPEYTPNGTALFQAGTSLTTIDRSIVFSPGAVRTCARSGVLTQIDSHGTNLFGPETIDGTANRSSCTPALNDIKANPLLAELADNNTIDFVAQTVSGFTYTHALLPGSPAIDKIAPDICGASEVHEINLGASQNATEINEGDIVRWKSTAARTAVFNDGASDMQLVALPGGTTTSEMQFNEPGSYVYRVYNPGTLDQADWGTITVLPGERLVDQREVRLPQRGSVPNIYRCDIGAYEFAPWVVGQPLPRPPSATGKQAPTWSVTGGASDTSGVYDAWSIARHLDLAARPTRASDPLEKATVAWALDDVTSAERIVQTNIVVWPDAPQLHISGAPVQLDHDAITDGYAVSAATAQAYEGEEPVLNLAGNIVSTNVFNRTQLTGKLYPGDSYTVLRFVKGTQTSADVRVLAVKTVDWNTPGIRDMRDRDATDGYDDTDCVIGRELQYPALTDLPQTAGTAATLGGHDDPEGRPGWLLSGTAYDGVPAAADLTSTENTTDGLVEPAHVRSLREGPIIPILDQAPTAFGNQNLVDGGHDLEVAWYLQDSRHIAWPVKSAGYRCRWPLDNMTAKIVIASELGSELGGQVILDTARYKDPTVYHQADPDKMGYSPNHEHALLAASALGNAAPALYALRTDLFDRDTQRPGSQSYALLKYRDAAQDGRIQVATYRVELTQDAVPITGAIMQPGTISPAAAAPGVTASKAAAPDAGALTLKVGSGVLSPYGTVTVPVEAFGAAGLRSISVMVSYDDALLAPVRCTPNRNSVAERPTNITVEAEQGVVAQQVVHLRARAQAGTDLRYEWNFGDGSVQYDSRETSHVYRTAGTYTVVVTVSNGFFEGEVSGQVAVTVADEPGVIELLEEEEAPFGCRITEPGTLVLDLRTLNRHGLSGSFKLADLEFGPGASWPAPAGAVLGITATELAGPDYSRLRYGITAGTPVYAPAPLRGLLDIQPCAETQAANDPDTGAKPVSFWKDWKGMLWTRAAGDMSVQYFYPLQTGFYLDDAYAQDHGLVDPDTGEALGEAERAGMCVPWLDELPEEAYPEDTEPLAWTDNTGAGRTDMVYPVAYASGWPALPALLNVGETVYERAKGGVSAIASQVAVSRVYDGLAGGEWNNASGTVEISGAGLDTYLAQLIDPLGEVSVGLDVIVNDQPGLPAGIKAERLLYGGGLSIVGTASDPDLNLPFSLRSRILYRDDGSLVFRGYYDGASPEYIKGDPLLLLNVMSLSDMYRLQALCDDDGNPDCATWDAAIEALYWKSLNPRGLDLCRNTSGETYPGDPDAIGTHAAEFDPATMTGCDSVDAPLYWRDGEPDRAYLIGVQDNDDNGIPEPFEGLGKGKALTAGNAAGTGYITLAYNNDSSLGGLPVSLQVIKVECAKNADNEESPYRGNVLVITSDNLFDEKLTLRHTGDFGGRPDNFEFEWWIAAVDDTGVSPTVLPPSYPWQKWTRLEPGLDALPQDYRVLGPEITIEGANPTTLRDNWVIVRYKSKTCTVCGNMYRYSAFAGDPSAKPTQVLGQLAEGWIKRVVGALNPFDARVDDFVNSQTSTSIDMLRQAGTRYEGPIAMNSDPENLNKVGLIEAYQTVLDRGRTLSIDAGVNDQGANAALLNVTSRIAQLYMLLGNDAYMDALDPIIGFDENMVALRAPALYAFANQFRPDQFGLIDEELALLRGRDETLGGVAAAPTYNRLTWNFTDGEGEVAYVTNYNLTDINLDGFINEADAAIMYPQGHGDAYGQQLTALSLYYQLLKHPNYTWIPRAEPVSVAGAPVVVDYYDERRFAAAAAARAKMGAEIVNLTYRKNYAEPEGQQYRDTHVDPSDRCDESLAPGCRERAWGVADWAGRTGEGAYFDWLMANAIIPPVDDRYTDLRKIDRTTVNDIADIANELEAIQKQLDHADQGLNPLGLTEDAVLFDLDPALTKTTPLKEGQTHFEQAYDKTISTMANTLKMFEYANQAKVAQRQAADQQYDWAADVVAQDRALINELIEIFGYPYDADIGVNGTYPEGYDGPDIYNFDLIERSELTDPKIRCTDEQIAAGECGDKVEVFSRVFSPMECLGFFVDPIEEGTVAAATLCPASSTYGISPIPETTRLPIEVKMGLGLDAGYGRYLPQAWGDDATRKALGDVQMKLWGVYDTRNEYEQSLIAYENHVAAVEQLVAAIKDRYEVLERTHQIKVHRRDVLDTLDTLIITAKEVTRGLNWGADLADKTFTETAHCIVTTYGMASDCGKPVVCSIELAGSAVAFGLKTAANIVEGVSDGLGFGKDVAEREFDLDLWELDADFQLREKGREMQALLREEQGLRLAAYLAADNYAGAWSEYDMAVQRGFRKLAELERLRKRWAGQATTARYKDMAYRMAENEALQKYRQQFDLAQTYTYLAAAAYDYETNLRGDDQAAGGKFMRNIAGTRSLGEIRWSTGAWDVEPIVGSGGLAEPLGKMRDNFVVLKGQMGFNNPQAEANRFSLRHELFRLFDSSDAAWRQTLARYYTPDIFADPIVGKLAKRPYGETGPEPGLVIPFGSTVTRRLNFFGNPLGPGDSSYSATQFATKIANVGVWFEGYDTARLAKTPRVYLLPGGQDVIRPRNTEGLLRYWNVTEQLLPLPYPITQADMANPNWIPGIDGLRGQLLRIKPYADMRAYPYTENLELQELNTDTRLIGRSVWNTNWVLVIPGATLLADPEMGIDRFMQDVDDIYVYFQTYAYAGTAAVAGDAASAGVAREEVAREDAAAVAANPKPQPDVVFYGTVLRDGTPLASGTLTAILPVPGTISTEIGPITGTGYNYEITIPLAQYDAGETARAAGFARLNDTVRFTVDGVPALLHDAAGTNYQAYQVAAAGDRYLITIDISGPGSYPPGDVNVSGKRDSADALLVLKYDVGLAQGVTTWPPGPGTVYTPLCDVTEDGACNSTDALRILMCDVKLASCPGGAAVAGYEAAALQDAPPAYLAVEQAVDAGAGEVVVQVRAASPHAPLAAAALGLRYDPSRLAVESCVENPAGWLDLAVCNPAFAADTLRYTGLTTGGIVEWTPLVEVRLRALAAGVLDELAAGGAALEIVDAALFDLDGNALRAEYGAQPGDGGPRRLYLPMILLDSGLPALPVEAGQPAAGIPQAPLEEGSPAASDPPAAATPTGETAPLLVPADSLNLEAPRLHDNTPAPSEDAGPGAQ